MGWTRQGNWHLTLKFLGDVDPARLDGLKAALAGVRFAPFALRGAGGGFFPPARAGRPAEPRVLWVGLGAGAEQASRLAAAVEDALEPLGFAREARPFSPHLTLARVKRAGRDDWGELVAALNATAWPEIQLDRFALWRSELGQGGPTYTPLAEFAAR